MTDRVTSYPIPLPEDGILRPVKGILPAALAARDAGRNLFVPAENAPEAALVKGLEILPANH